MSEHQRRGPLAGIKVLDLSRVLAGPFCCQLLADLGADVVKVERPGSGDDTRQWGPPFLGDDGPSAYYLSCNRGKRSLALELANPGARDVLDDLVRAADAMVENFLPQSLTKLGLDPDRLAAINPRLVHVVISGYGRTGPESQTPGYDLVVQAISGFMSITGEPGGAPMKVGVAMTDILSGLYAAVSVLAGLLSGDRGGALAQGGTFDIALADAALASLVNVAQSALVTGERPRRYGNAHPQIVPYEAFATADGYLVLAVGNDAQWRKFCSAIAAEGLAADPRFATNPDRVAHRPALTPLLTSLFRRESTAQWQAVLATAGVPHGPVLPLDETLALPQFAAREMLPEITDAAGRRYRVVGNPIHIDGAAIHSSLAPPDLGQHNDEVLADWLGYGPDRVAALRAAGAIT